MGGTHSKCGQDERGIQNAVPVNYKRNQIPTVI